MTNEQQDALVTSMTREIYNGYAKRVHGDAFVPYDALLGSMQMVWQEITQAALAAVREGHVITPKPTDERYEGLVYKFDRLTGMGQMYWMLADGRLSLVTEEPHGRAGGGDV